MAAWLRHHLFGHVMPFWEKHAIDERGGLCTCLDDSGAILSTEKWLWSQWRAVWVFSKIHNSLDRDARWIARAEHIAEFCARHGWDASDDGWALVLSREGKILRGYESIYVDAFAIYGLTELFTATAEPRWLRLACQTADAALKKLARPPGEIPHFPYPIPPGAKPHGIPMLWSFTLAELAIVSGGERYAIAARQFSEEIFRDFLRRDRNCIVEFVRPDGREFDGPQGTAVVPGHAIENLWFQIHVSRLLARGNSRANPGETGMFRLILRHLELGWDRREPGGLLLAIDADGRSDVGWNHADTKLWWPVTEALYAALLGWHETREPEFFSWYERLWRLALSSYVNWQDGDWRQKLDRSLAPIDHIVALPVKDPFHLPRSLILQIELLERGVVSSVARR